MRTLPQTCELQIPWSFLSAHSSIPSPGSFVLQYEPSDVSGIPGDLLNTLPYHQTNCRSLEGAKFSAFLCAEQCWATVIHTMSNSHADNSASRSFFSTEHRRLEAPIRPRTIVNGIVKTSMVLFVRRRQVIHPTANSFHCQHCPEAMLRRKWREGSSRPHNLLYLSSFPKLFGTSKSRGARCKELGRDCLKCWNKGCLPSLTVFMLLAAPSTM